MKFREIERYTPDKRNVWEVVCYPDRLNTDWDKLIRIKSGRAFVKKSKPDEGDSSGLIPVNYPKFNRSNSPYEKYPFLNKCYGNLECDRL